VREEWRKMRNWKWGSAQKVERIASTFDLEGARVRRLVGVNK
jgi:hypothetical protein